jgi:8-oxo-dGTP pyrophosphatase MutT (NUDIX family)
MPQQKYAKLQISIKALLQNTKGESLLLGCIPTGSMPGYYDFPGGRIAPHEIKLPLDKILARELHEELGKNVRFRLAPTPSAIGKQSYTKKGKTHEVLWVLFKAKYLGGHIQLSSEHISYQWKRISKQNAPKFFTKGALDTIKNYLSTNS